MKALIAAGLLAATTLAQAATPKEIVTAFMEQAFVQGQATAAAQKYISADKYIQHNPQAADGREAFIKGFAGFIESSPYRCVIKRVMADGDLVVVHSHCKEKPTSAKDRGAAVVDIFRVEGEKIVEHWDVEQKVPAKAANKNTMF